MRTKLLYILSSSESDNYLESALISIYSAKFRMPEANIVLLVDDITNKNFVGNRTEILNFISEKIVVNFEKDIGFKERSRLLKTNMRYHISGDFLYLDCDTIIACPLYDIEFINSDIAAVLDGHSLLEKHPAREIFVNQSKVFNYSFEEVNHYFSSGVMYIKDSEVAYNFFNRWYTNYKFGLSLGITPDEPSLAKTNFDFGNIISEMPGEWNCQIRLGALYLKDLKILHFWSKRNMPLSYLGSKEFLHKLREEGLNNYKELIIEYQKNFYEPLGLVSNSDLYFNFSPLYEEIRKVYIEEGGVSYFINGLAFIEKADKTVTQTNLGKFMVLLNRFIFRIELLIVSLFQKSQRNRK